LARLNSEKKLGVKEFLTAVIEQQRIDAIAERKIHARCDENIFVAISVEVAHADSPGPKLFDADLVGNLLELTVAKVVIERVAKDEFVAEPPSKLSGE